MSRKEYFDLLIRLAQDGRPEPLKRVIEARVQERFEPMTIDFGEGPIVVCSPPLERDEPDVNALLYTVYAMLRTEATALENLRRAVVELFMAALRAGPVVPKLRLVIPGVTKFEPPSGLNYLARLVGHLRVVDSPSLQPDLHLQLYGYLMGGLPKTFDEAIDLEEEWLRLATVALDVWVSVLPLNPDCPEQVGAKVMSVLNNCTERAHKGKLEDSQFAFTLLVFRALAKIQPAEAAGRGILEMSRIVDRHSTLRPELNHKWIALCHHLSVVFKAHPEWRAAFVAGLDSGPNRRVLDNSANDLFRESLECLGLLEEARDLILPKPPSSTKISWGPRRVIS